ncbi:MAG: HAD-IA family hydrolase [Pseudomonadota bacterium]
MSISALLFGAIGTLAETTDLQRRAYNHAFAEAELEWVWDRESYLRMLHDPGGRARLTDYANASGDTIDADAIHALKKRHFTRLVEQEGIQPRPGVLELLRTCQRRDIAVALCTTTDPEQVDLILDNLAPGVGVDDFDWIGDRGSARRPKPSPDIYAAALAELDLPADDVLAIEDTPESAEAALKAGIRTIAFPGEAAANREFQSGVLIVDRLQARLVDLQSGRRVAAE